MNKIECIVSGFCFGVVLMTYIYVIVIHKSVRRLLKGIENAADEADYEIGLVERIDEYAKEERIARLRMCRDFFRILSKAIRIS